jgi:hypothetical protein
MTLLMVWTNKARDPTAINIASDSLLSGGSLAWPYAAKIHRLYPTREYFGYCGGSFAALSAITSSIATISCSDHLSKTDSKDAPTIAARIDAIHRHLHDTFAVIPKEWDRTATLLLAGFDPRKAIFSAWTIRMTETEVCKPESVDLVSKRVHCFGSGADVAETRISKLAMDDRLTTKDVVRVLIEVIDKKEVPTVGGAPQMVMLTRKKDVPVGFWWRGTDARRHLFGLPIDFSSKMNRVKWVNEDFEDRELRLFGRSD